jgi:DNA-binding MarR family transcriptional regulator
MLGEPLDRLFKFLRRANQETAKAFDLTPTQVRALRVLSLEGPRRLGELAGWMELSNSACSTMIDQLEKRGLILKREDPGDRRSIYAETTPEGARVAQALAQATFAQLAERVSRLGLAERYMVLGGLEALGSVLD